MHFGDMQYNAGFLPVILAVLFFAWAYRKKKEAMNRFVDKELFAEIARSVNFKREVIKYAVIIAALALSVVTLMRPQWGFQWQETKRKGLDILIAIDTSKSMLASDVKPNRLERSKLAVKDLLKNLKGDRIGLIAFAGTAFLECPLTADYDGFMLSLDDISSSTIPRGGTSISGAINEAVKSYKNSPGKYKILILITDGEDHEGDSLAAAKKAADAGIRIFCVGIGTAEGDLIQVRDEAANMTFLKDSEGNVVKTRLDESLLQKIAMTTDGMYVRSSGAEFGLDLIYDQKLSKMDKRDIASKMKKIYYERFQVPLILVLLLLCAESLMNRAGKND